MNIIKLKKIICSQSKVGLSFAFWFPFITEPLTEYIKSKPLQSLLKFFYICLRLYSQGTLIKNSGKLTGKWDRQEWTGNKLQRKSNEKKSKKLCYICNNKITITSSYVCWLLHTVTFAVVPLNVTLSSQEWCQTLQRTTEKKTDSCTLWCVLISPAQSEGKSPLENDRFPMNAQISQKTNDITSQ